MRKTHMTGAPSEKSNFVASHNGMIGVYEIDGAVIVDHKRSETQMHESTRLPNLENDSVIDSVVGTVEMQGVTL